MKFSEISQASWSELQPYLDTCVIPFTGLTGLESPVEATASLERLRDFMDLVETRYKGRIVTYPAFHYQNQEIPKSLNELCHRVKESGFKYAIIMTADTILEESKVLNCDLILSQQQLAPLFENDQTVLSSIIQDKVESLWKTKR
ncbi:DUF2487 family protein [Paenibacillus macquariensis]|uniref:DUF2487 domain-containing protein n=1 Tax=Paenibacillus macquariensis TaxID=948756 RepID=A0ABY1JJK5_9BACL|nr:DUF2487 family protein [Paenibacillus macquariensis]MEC0089741.1 DUF2487 family protein [Paenibacillus macquariensis]OAB30781.1 hypothetical protein PMSM_21840 [Paenibacillus macquariensis subsp. macquariensis]SIQ30129.1 Protein of unknown function [Paenibacillus macquariensis]